MLSFSDDVNILKFNNDVIYLNSNDIPEIAFECESIFEFEFENCKSILNKFEN